VEALQLVEAHLQGPHHHVVLLLLLPLLLSLLTAQELV
jgi:hypothetical protein